MSDIIESPEDLDGVLFKERQRFSNWLLWVVLLSLVVGVWFWFVGAVILDTSSGVNSKAITPDWFVALMWVTVGIVAPVIVASLRFDVRIEKKDIIFQYFPFHLKEKRLPIKDLLNYKIVRYDPVGDYGGYGVRKRKNTLGYITSSDRGIIVLIQDDLHITFGTDNPKEFFLAIDRIHKHLYPKMEASKVNATIKNAKKKI